MLIYMEPGGACWDYESCSGAQGIRGRRIRTASPTITWSSGPSDRLCSVARARSSDLPTEGYNMVFVPYCTGDIHAGNNVIDYPCPMAGRFGGTTKAPRTCARWASGSATASTDGSGRALRHGLQRGGVGSIANYYFIRNMFTRVGRGVMLDDAGPIFPTAPGPVRSIRRSVTAGTWTRFSTCSPPIGPRPSRTTSATSTRCSPRSSRRPLRQRLLSPRLQLLALQL